MFPRDNDEVAAAIGESLLVRGARVGTAESTAGGLISVRLLSVPGASKWFDRGLVAYSISAKTDILGLSLETYREKGAVDPGAVAATAETVRDDSGLDYIVAESGIAGPIQGRSSKPIGTCSIAVSGPTGTESAAFQFAGTRAEIMVAISEQALQMLLEAIAP